MDIHINITAETSDEDLDRLQRALLAFKRDGSAAFHQALGGAALGTVTPITAAKGEATEPEPAPAKPKRVTKPKAAPAPKPEPVEETGADLATLEEPEPEEDTPMALLGDDGTEPEAPITLADLREVGAELVKTGEAGKNELRKILSKHDAKALSSLAEEHYVEAHAAIIGALATANG